MIRIVCNQNFFDIVNVNERTTNINNVAEKVTKKRRASILPWGYAEKIAKATGYSKSMVYKVAQGHVANERIQQLVELGKQDSLAFARACEREYQAQRILSTI